MIRQPGRTWEVTPLVCFERRSLINLSESIALCCVMCYLAGKWLSRRLRNETDDVGKCGSEVEGGTVSTHSLYLCDDAAELRSILGEGQQVADGAADGLGVVRGFNLFDQDLQHIKRKTKQNTMNHELSHCRTENC